MAYTKPDFTFNDTNRAIIRFNRECVVEIEATPDRNTVTQYGFSVHITNELLGNEYGYTGNLPIIDGPDMPEEEPEELLLMEEEPEEELPEEEIVEEEIPEEVPEEIAEDIPEEVEEIPEEIIEEVE